MRKDIIYIYLNGIGEALMAIWVCDSIIKKYPGIRIYFLVRRNFNLISDLSKHYNNIRIISYSSKPHIVIGLVAKSILKDKLVVTPPTFGRISLLNKVFASILALPSFKNNTYFLDKAKLNLPGTALFFDYNNLYIDELVKAFSVLDFSLDKNYTFNTSKLNEDTFNTYNLVPDSYCVYHPFATNELRTYPDSLSVKLLLQINNKYPQMPIIITCTANTLDRAKGIVEQVYSRITNNNIKVLCDLNILDVAVLIKRSRIFIGVDTGNVHLAGVLRHNTILIGNRSNPTWLPYYNNNAKILFSNAKCNCLGNKRGDCSEILDGNRYYRCMVGIDTKDIVDLIR